MHAGVETSEKHSSDVEELGNAGNHPHVAVLWVFDENEDTTLVTSYEHL